MANLDQSINLKNHDLQEALDKAESIINDPNANADEAKEAMNAVTALQKDIENLEALKTVSPTTPSEHDSLSESDSNFEEENLESELSLPDSSESENLQSELASDFKQEDINMEGRTMPVKVTKTAEVEITENKRTKEAFEAEKRAFNDFVRSGGEKRDGITTADVGVLIPVEIVYEPSMEVKTIYDLASLVTKTKVKTKSGNYPILKKPNQTLPTVAELEKNPDLGKPDFIDVKWEITTRRGAIPLSQESIDDTEIDLSALIADYVQQIKLNTTNALVANELKSFTKATVTAASFIDDLKKVVNVKLDVAYQKAFVVTQSAFNILDTLKDGQGRYYLQPDVTQSSDAKFLGKPLFIVEDEAFGGTTGSAQLWIGDLKRAILYADRLDIAVQWAWSEIYGKYLQAVIRLDVEVADDKAGYFVDIPEAVGA